LGRVVTKTPLEQTDQDARLTHRSRTTEIRRGTEAARKRHGSGTKYDGDFLGGVTFQAGVADSRVRLRVRLAKQGRALTRATDRIAGVPWYELR